MDSLTQLTLGAAVGEIVLGKKIGNRAMIWGAAAGTLPDLDVLSNFVADEMTALAFHRGISHSITFAVLAPLILGKLTHSLYNSGLYQNQKFKNANFSFWIILGCLTAVGMSMLPKMAGGEQSIGTMGIGLALMALLGTYLWRNYLTTPLQPVNATYKEWGMLWFWGIFTHPLLDCCTTYGTQLFQPFSDYRVAFNNISVADPIYTIPLILGVLIAGRMTRDSSKRRIVNWVGIGLSCGYLALTFYNKYQVNQVFERALAAKNITYKRYMTGPVIFNNILWNGIAEGDTAYYHGMYSLLDEAPVIDQINTIPKNRSLIAKYQDDENLKTLRWFSDDYWNVVQREDGELQFNDLRFGSIRGDAFSKENDYVFRFILEDKDGNLYPTQTRDNNVEDGDFENLINRIKGLKDAPKK